MLVPLASATAADETSSFLTSAWRLYDGYVASWHDVINTTNKGTYVDLIFFDDDGDFCGCDTYWIDPYGSLKFWTDDEYYDNAIFCEYTTGQLKVIAFQKTAFSTSFVSFQPGGALVGYTTIERDEGYIRNSASMKALTQNTTEMQTLHKMCLDFWSNGVDKSRMYRPAKGLSSPLHGND